MMEKLKALFFRYRELLLYGVFGAGTVAVDMALYALLVDRTGIRWANVWSWCGAVLFAFFTNKYLVFQRSREGARAFGRELLEFVAARLASLLVQVGGVELLFRMGLNQSVLGVTGGLSKALVTVLVILINYVLSKFLIFRRKEGDR